MPTTRMPTIDLPRSLWPPIPTYDFPRKIKLVDEVGRFYDLDRLGFPFQESQFKFCERTLVKPVDPGVRPVASNTGCIHHPGCSYVNRGGPVFALTEETLAPEAMLDRLFHDRKAYFLTDGGFAAYVWCLFCMVEGPAADLRAA